MEELHVDDVEQLLIQLANVNDVAGQEAGFRSVDAIRDNRCSKLDITRTFEPWINTVLLQYLHFNLNKTKISFQANWGINM